MKFTFPHVTMSALALIIAACSQQADNTPVAAAPAASTTPDGMAMGAGMAGMAGNEAALTDLIFTNAPLMNPNTAEMMALASLPGLSQADAQALVDARPFATPSEMNAVLSSRKSEAELRAIYSAVFVKVGLNSGENEDFRLVPSSLSARKLAHEFEEYRPYKTMDDFTREMAKYVSAEEVSFLTRYVTLD